MVLICFDRRGEVMPWVVAAEGITDGWPVTEGFEDLSHALGSVNNNTQSAGCHTYCVPQEDRHEIFQSFRVPSKALAVQLRDYLSDFGVRLVEESVLLEECCSIVCRHR